MHGTAFWLRRIVLLSLITFSIGIQVSPLSSHHASVSSRVTDIYQFSRNGSFIDNIVFRQDGTLLLTRIDVPEVWSIDPCTGAGSLVYTFSRNNASITSCFGITEIEHDIFAVVAGTFNVHEFAATPGSFGVWKLDFTRHCDKDGDISVDQHNTRKGKKEQNLAPTVSKIVDIPEAKALGASTLFKTRQSQFLLISDSPEGMIWTVDLDTGKYNNSISDSSMLPAPNGPAMGVNGIQVHDGYLYYASVTKKEFRRVRIDDTASSNGPYELIRADISLDNFDMAADGTAYMATNTENMIMKLTAEGEIVRIAGDKNSTALAGPTCCRLHPDGKKLFIGTNGGSIAPVNGWFKEPGKVAAVEA